MGAVLVAGASVPFAGVGVAQADTTAFTAVSGAYFNASGVDKPEQSPAAPPNVAATADGVSAENLPVAAKGGTEDKVSFLLFDVLSVPVGSTVDKAVLRVLTVPNDPPHDLSFQAAPEKVQACMAGDRGFSGDDGANLSMSAPERKCAAFKAVGKASADGKAYEFDVTGLAATWVAGVNDGVALTVADAATSSNFQVVFGKAATATLALDYTAPVDLAPPVTTPIDSGVGTIAPPVADGFAPAPSVDFTSPSVPDFVAPSVPNPQPQTPPVAVAPGTVPVASAFTPLKDASMRPTGAFWLVGLVVAGLVALLSLILGDSEVPTTTGSTTRLAKALSSRQGVATAKAGFRTSPA